MSGRPRRCWKTSGMLRARLRASERLRRRPFRSPRTRPLQGTLKRSQTPALLLQRQVEEERSSRKASALPPLCGGWQSPSVLQCDFREFAARYSGPRFNFVHCDFPYGKNPFAGAWGGSEDEGFQYEDTDDLYWELVETLCAHRERLLTPSAHLMFWLDADIARQHETIERFRRLAPDLIFQPRALIWLKSDNVGIAPDPQRGPRWVTEVALMASRGDRKLLQPLANGYPAPTARHLHPSAKPEPMLRHFFRMFVDGTTRMLDPTCGAGSSLRAAESLGACGVLGLERDEQYAQSALKALREFQKSEGACKMRKSRSLVLRHSFANPFWWSYQWSLVWWHTTCNGVRY